MPNTETVRALVSAFNVHNYARNTVKTNFTLHSNGTGSYIVVSFDRGMNGYQCKEYLDSIKRKIVGEFYGIEERDTDEVVLNTANLIFKIESFPFNTSKGEWFRDEQNGFKFVTPADGDVIFNLKSHLASSLKKDVLEGMSACRIVTKVSNKKDCLWHGKFSDKESRKQFEREFLSRMENRYGYRNFFKKPLEVKGDSVYIKDVFDDARFIDSVTQYIAWLKGMGLQNDSKVRNDVKAFKNLIIEFIDQPTGIIVDGFVCASPLGREVASILVPIMRNGKGGKLLTKDEARAVNSVFGNTVLNDLYGRTQGELSTNGSNGIYGIDFSNKEISHCVITKIIESSVINKDHELAIDPERALSPAQSPLNSPTHAGPSGLRTPPKQRQEDRDSGYDSNSPPKPKDSGAHSPSGGPGPSTELSYMEWESPTRSQDGALKRSPRQGSGKEEEGLLYNSVNLAGTSKGFWPPTQLSYTTVSQGVSGPSSQSVSAAKNVQAGPSTWAQQPNRWSSQGTSGNKWQSSPEPGPSGLSWKGATKNVPAGTSAWSQQPNRWSSPASSTGLWSLPQMSSFVSGPSSSKGANPVGANLWTKNSNPLPPLPPLVSLIPLPVSGSSVSGFSPLVSFTSTQNPYPLPPPPPLIPSSGGIVPRFRLPVARPSSSRGAQAGANISEKEEKLIEALLYWFNLNNYALDPPHTNFIAENGKIASLIDDSVNVKEYLQEIIDKTKEEYRVNKEEAYDLNEFPFQFLSNCEKNQEITVVANISRGALLNLKKLFSREHEGKVEIKDIDINIVEKAVKSEKNKWVNFQVQEHGLLPQKAIETCYPDESALEYISITKDKGGYWINRNYDASEVRSFRKEQWPAKGTRNTTTTFKKIEESKKDDSSSGYSSGFVTDAENVSSKAEAITSSGYESMDCENTRGGSPKRTLELSMGMEELAISTDLDATKAEQHSPIKKFRSN